MRVNPRHEKAAMRVHAVQNTMGSDTRKMNPSVDSRSSDAGSAPCGGTEPYVREPERNFPDPSGAAPGTPPDSMSPAASPREERIADRDASLHREALALRSGRSPRAGDASRVVSRDRRPAVGARTWRAGWVLPCRLTTT